jgi:sulfatase maturation enzyme AslB (radical SAM superfamily)
MPEHRPLDNAALTPLIIATLPTHDAAMKTVDPVALLRQAQILAEAQRLVEAERVLAGLPNHPECAFRRAQLLTALERHAEAEPCFRAVQAMVPGHLDSMVGLAGALVELGRPGEAVPLLTAAARAQPNSARIRYLHGVALDEAGGDASTELAVARAMVIAPAERRGLVPWEVYLQISRRCNLRCAMCGHEVWQSNSGFMDWAVFERTLAECKANGVKTLHILSGQGEPLLHPQVFEMLEKAVAEGFEVGIVTNGTPLTPERIGRLAGLGLAYIQFSFAGWDKASYEGTYIGAKFERTLDNLRALDAAVKGTRTSFVVKAVATEDWEATLEKTAAFLRAQGIERVFTVVGNNFGGHVQLGRYIEKHGVWSQKHIDHHRRMPCRVLLKSVGVFCDGTVTACACYDSNAELKIGHIMEQGLVEIRNGAPFRRILESFRCGDLADIPMCGTCDDPFG